MGSPRQDRQQPIIIQNLDLLLPGQLKFRRKPLSTANLYLSAASLRRQTGVLLDDHFKCLKSDSPCGCVPVDTSSLNTSDYQVIDSSLREQAVGIVEPVFQSGAYGGRLDQGKQTSIYETPAHMSRSTSNDQVSLSRSAYPDVPNTSWNDFSTGNSDISNNHNDSHSNNHSNISINQSNISNNQSNISNNHSNTSNNHSYIRNNHSNNSNNHSNISNNHSGKIEVPRHKISKDNSVRQLAQNNTSVTKQNLRHLEPWLTKVDSGSENKTTHEVFVKLELNHSQLSFELLPAEGSSETESSFDDRFTDGHITTISSGVQNSKSHVTDKTISGEEKNTTLNRCDLLSSYKALNISMEEADSNSTSDGCCERNTQKGERTRTKIKRVSFKLTEDEDVDKGSNSDVSMRELTGVSKWDRDQVSSSVRTDNVGQSEAGNVKIIPQHFNTGNVSGYRCDPSVHSSDTKQNYNPLYKAPTRRYKPFSLREQQSSRAGDRPSHSSQSDPRQNTQQKFLTQKYVMKRRAGDSTHSPWKEEVASLNSFPDQQHGCELLQANKNYQFHNKLGNGGIDNYTGRIDSVCVSNKTVSTKPDSKDHTDSDQVLIKPKSESDTYKDPISITINPGSDVNTDYLKRMYSSCGNRVGVLDIARVLDKDASVDPTSLPEEELTDFSRHAGHINRKKTDKSLNNPITKWFEEPEQEELFSVRVRRDERMFACPRIRSVSAKEKLFIVKDNMKYVDRYLFQVDRRENQRTRMNKRLEDLIVGNLRHHRPTAFLESSRTSLL